MRLSSSYFVGLVLLALGLGPVLHADVITLQNGRVYEGAVLSDNADELICDTIVAGIRAQINIKKADIKTHDHKPLAPDFFTKKEPAKTTPTASGAASAPAEPAEPADKSGTRYLVLPLQGVFGEDIFPESIASALDYAAKRDSIKHIVLTIDSPGGQVWAANAILKIMEDRQDRFKFHIVVKAAISASIWVVFSCDTIHVVDAAVIGGAVPYKTNSSGSAEVDAKFASILAAKISSRAESKGYPSGLVQAMMIRSATFAAWRLYGNDKVQCGLVKPPNVPPDALVVLDTPDTILTLTHDQAIAIGVAHHMPATIQDLGAELGFNDWALYNNYGEYIVAKSTAELKQKHAKLKKVWDANLASLTRLNASAENHIGNAKSAKFYNDLIREIGAARRDYEEMRQIEKQDERVGLPRVFGSDLEYQVRLDALQNDQKRFIKEEENARRH